MKDLHYVIKDKKGEYLIVTPTGHQETEKILETGTWDECTSFIQVKELTLPKNLFLN